MTCPQCLTRSDANRRTWWFPTRTAAPVFGASHRGVEERYLAREKGDPAAYGRRTEASAEERALDAEATSSMVLALGTLPQRQREVLTMRYYLDLSEAEIADALGISAGSVKAHAHRGLAALRDRMEATS